MTVLELEDAVWALDRLRIVVRAPGATFVENFDRNNAADQGMSITNYLRVRIKPCTGNLEVTVIDGKGLVAHGRTLVRTVRSTYQQ